MKYEEGVKRYEEKIISVLGDYPITGTELGSFVAAMIHVLCASCCAMSGSQGDFDNKRKLLKQIFNETVDEFEFKGEIHVQ